jgi:inhibitor of KinA sporulation pathway (predicted exonuclease)
MEAQAATTTKPSEMPARPRTLVNVIDVESTCWKPFPKDQISDIIEIGITVLDYETLEILSTESIIIKPKHSTISEFCTQLTTLTPEFVEEHGIAFAEAASILEAKYDPKNRLFASYGNYDRKMFQKQFELHGLPYAFGEKHLNIKSLFASAHALRREVGMDSALRAAGIPLQGTHHRGGDDSRNIAALLAHVVAGQHANPQFRAALAQFAAHLP